MRHNNRFKIGFTLIELLVVISVIALLMAILTPVLHKVRHLAAEKFCANNLREVNKALVIYANSNDYCYPLDPTEHNDPGQHDDPDDDSHRNLLKKLGAYKDGSIFEIFYCPRAKDMEMTAQSLTAIPQGATDSVIDTPENREIGNIGYVYWRFKANKHCPGAPPGTGNEDYWRNPDYFLPRHLKLTGAVKVRSGPAVPKASTAERWVMSDFFRRGPRVTFPHGRKKGSEGGGLNVVFLDGHVDLVKGRPRDSYR